MKVIGEGGYSEQWAGYAFFLFAEWRVVLFFFRRAGESFYSHPVLILYVRLLLPVFVKKNKTSNPLMHAVGYAEHSNPICVIVTHHNHNFHPAMLAPL